MARLSVLAITAVAVIAIPKADAVDTSRNAAETEEVTVTGEATGSGALFTVEFPRVVNCQFQLLFRKSKWSSCW